ncbi:hypothetical protein QE152_g30775 [Popillia japonica]|uniref:HTH psq-type domain-containing protein n=1 Tax=Popillia japonica TaxID=7064 RepID=A0AAW1JCY3_POPJA
MASTSATLSKITKKKTRRKLNLETKLKIIEMLEKDSKISEVARLHNLNESTIRTIKSNTNSIKLAVREAIPTSSKLVKYTRDSVMVKMEKLLVQWIEDNNKKHIGMDTRIIQSKALSIFNQLKEKSQKHIGMDTRIIQSKALSIFNQLKEKSQIGKDKEGIGGKSSSFVASKVIIPPEVDELTDEEQVDDDLLRDDNVFQDIAGSFEIITSAKDDIIVSEPSTSSITTARKKKKSKTVSSPKWERKHPEYTSGPTSAEYDNVQRIKNTLADKTPLEVFLLYFDEEVLQLIFATDS